MPIKKSGAFPTNASRWPCTMKRDAHLVPMYPTLFNNTQYD